MGALRVAVAVLLFAGAAWTARAQDTGQSVLGALLEARALRGARVGVAVADLVSGRVLLESDSKRPLVPASNQKILTSAAALLFWGPTYRFETLLVAGEALGEDGRLEGPLWVVGSGDPSLVSETLWKMAEELRLAGLREVPAGLAVDAEYFDTRTTHGDWEPISSRAYHARTAAFAANYSSFRIDVVAADRLGDRAVVYVAPDVGYFRLRSNVPTTARRGPLRLGLARLPDGSGETVSLSGAMAAGSEPKTFWRSVQLPTRYAASLLRRQLDAQGVRVAESLQIVAAPEDAVELVRFRGDSLSQIVRRLNKYSNNFIAEQLVKALGADWTGGRGSWPSGTQAVHQVLDQRGLLDPGTIIADGSGLSPRNRVSPATLVRVIRAVSDDFAAGPEFLASLPLGGLDGTLEDRMEDPRVAVRGKTGHLNHVSALSGVLSTATGRRLAFAVIVNGGRGGREAVDDAIDSFVSGLAQLEWDDSAPGSNQPLAEAGGALRD
jgi:D-alanyl-D-alanine carboxypeptidase/D-alanyl-D-alanine-endopeptidase (penicillin-binding protein 4)